MHYVASESDINSHITSENATHDDICEVFLLFTWVNKTQSDIQTNLAWQ
jgi:hypothetical protein